MASSFIEQRSESPCKVEVVDLIDNGPERGRATLEVVFTLWSDLFNAVTEIREKLINIPMKV